ncbi:MAG TPA: MerR family transcriptional regulator [Thermoanaerobaculia bacterium]|jgi:DNA-binding transcriptional MerR regulator
MADSANSGGETRYKIGDVCRIADVQPYVLRYWESEFPVLAPDKSIPGPRTYSARELKLIERIKRLLYDEGYTIAGAKKRLESEGSGKAESKDAGADTNPAVIPIPEAPKPPKAEKPRPPRPTKAAVELPAPEVTKPVEVAAGPPQWVPADDRVVRAVAELKELLDLLSRPLP